MLTPERAIENGYVVVGEGSTIKAVAETQARRAFP